jgi:hypothetical protein
MLPEEGQHLRARRRELRFGDGILQIEDQRIGARTQCLGLFSLAIAGYEQQRPERRCLGH